MRFSFGVYFMPKILKIKVIAGVKKSEVSQRADGTLKVRLKSPAKKGKANEELIGLLAKFFKIPKNRLEIIKGEFKANKIIKIN